MADKTGGANAPPIAIKQVEQEEDEAKITSGRGSMALAHCPDFSAMPDSCLLSSGSCPKCG